MLGPVLLGSVLLAPPASTADTQAPTVVLMVPEQPGDYDERILATVAANLHELDVTLITQRCDPSLDLRGLVSASREPIERSNARGVLWIDVPVRASGDLALYVVERDSPQIYGRTIAGDVGEAVAIETLANVAAMAVTALLEGRAIRLDASDEPGPEFEPAPAPEPAPEPEPAPIIADITREGAVEPVTRPWLRLRVGYRGNSYAAALPWQSSVMFAIGVRPVADAHVELVGDVAIPGKVVTPELELDVRRHAIGLAGGYAWPLPRGWDLELSGRIALEPTRREVIPRVAELVAQPADLQWFASAELGLAASVRLADTARLSLGAGAAAMLVRRDFVVSLPEGEQTVLSPQPLRAIAWIGFDFDLVWR